MSLAYIMANRGYDVWIGNNRGNKYSRNHIELDPNKDAQFWDFSFEEMGKYDLPAMISYIVKETGREKISYVGHSQGTSQFFSGMTFNPEFFKKHLNFMGAFGPVTTMRHFRDEFFILLSKTNLDNIMKRMGIFNEIFTDIKAADRLKKFTCKHFGLFCDLIIGLFADKNPFDNDQERLWIMFEHYPSGSSLKSVHHYAEMVRRKVFAPIDRNLPPYDLTKIKGLPVGLFVGDDDLLASVGDNRDLKAILEENGSLEFYKEYEKMGHATFFLSKDNKHINDLLPILDKYNN